MTFKKNQAVVTGSAVSTKVTEVSVAKMQLEFATKVSKLVEEFNKLPETANTILANVEAAKESLGLDLKVKEIEVADAISKLEASIEAKKEEFKVISVDLDTKVDAKNKQLDIEIEDLEHKHKLAIRDKNLYTAITIAKSLSKSIVDDNELATLKANELTEAKQKEIEDKIKKDVTNSLEKSHGFEVREIKSQNSTQIQLLTKELEMTKAELAKAEVTIAEQKATISNFPKAITDTVAAAKANINVGTDNSSKR